MLPHQCLWENKGCQTQSPTHYDEEREFHRIRHTPLEKILESDGSGSPLTITVPPRRSLEDIMNSSLVVGQEVALSALLLGVHGIIVEEESTCFSVDKQRDVARETSLATVLVYSTLLVIVYYHQKALNCQSTSQTGQRRIKAMVRTADAILLAAMLCLTSGIIHALTASYSSGNIYALSLSGMIIHLLTCDYRYANGIASDADSSSLHTTLHPGSAFLGGTMSFNAVFFSTAMLVSRIESNASSYAFVSLAVTLFAFYPAARHIAGRYQNTLWGSPCFIITLTLSVIVWLILASLEKIIFLFIQSTVLILSPCIQWDLQKHKKHISGRWDIAHISAAEVGKSKSC